jgi:hypothetical protein
MFVEWHQPFGRGLVANLIRTMADNPALFPWTGRAAEAFMYMVILVSGISTRYHFSHSFAPSPHVFNLNLPDQPFSIRSKGLSVVIFLHTRITKPSPSTCKVCRAEFLSFFLVNRAPASSISALFPALTHIQFQCNSSRVGLGT